MILHLCWRSVAGSSSDKIFLAFLASSSKFLLVVNRETYCCVSCSELDLSFDSRTTELTKGGKQMAK
jgi:hypothetical protein